MPNSLDEEETQCLLACEDNLTSNFCDDGDQDDIEAQVENNSRKCTNSQKMNSSSSSNKLDFLSNDFDVHPTTSNPNNTSIPKVISSTDTNQTLIHSNSSQKDVATSEYVVPTLGNDWNKNLIIS